MDEELFQKPNHNSVEDAAKVEVSEGFQKSILQSGDLNPSSNAVNESLKLILESPVFRSSKRGSQFLRFVVQYRLQGHPEPLKERIIGAALFNRPLDYSTGDDSVVRAQAREVRRRLEKYYAAYSVESAVHIALPVGSYTPEFSWAAPSHTEDAPSRSMSLPGPSTLIDLRASRSSPVLAWMSKKLIFGVAAVCACLLLSVLVWRSTRTAASDGVVSQFWSPAFASSKPLLICLPKPVLYRPSAEIYKRTAKSPGEFDHEIDRMTHAPHLRAEDTMRWGDMVEFYDYGVSQGDVEAAIRLSNFMGRQGKDSEVRIGNGYSSADLRNSPAVVIGAFSNPLTIEMTAGLHFAFLDDSKGLRIQEDGPSGRSWYPTHGPIGEDFGLVTRLLDSGTGQFVVLVAGVEASGSDAAADLIVHSDSLENALRGFPKDWSKKNLQILVSTTVKDGIAGPPRVVAIYAW